MEVGLYLKMTIVCMSDSLHISLPHWIAYWTYGKLIEHCESIFYLL